MLAAVVAVCVVATVVGLVAYWPDGDDQNRDPFAQRTELVDADVVDVITGPCATSGGDDTVECDLITFAVTSGPTEGDLATIELTRIPSNPVVADGDRIVLGYTAEAPEGFRYYFADFNRTMPLLALAAALVVAIVALGGFQGLRAVIALGISLATLVVFTLPALLETGDALAVAVTSAAFVAIVALYLTHGVNHLTTMALLSAFGALGLTAVLARLWVEAANLTGLASEETLYLQIGNDVLDARGLLLAGIVIGSLGVLDDVTVTQVSAVQQLHLSDPSATFSSLFRSALVVGRDHIASVANTLVLAYAGASLPLLLLFTQSNQGFGRVITSELVASEVIQTAVGTIGLVAAVPLSTALAAVVVAGGRPRP